MNLYFYKFNNYYNRVIKSYPNLNDYGQPVETMTGNVNFYSVNGVIANQVVNHTESQIASYDYMLVLDDYFQIISRWFVLDYARTNSQRATLNLRRDLIADNWDNVLNNDMMYIEKGTTNINDTKFFNEENLVINKRKIAELPIKTVAWAVAYVRPNTIFNQQTFNATSVSNISQDYIDLVNAVRGQGYTLVNYFNGQIIIEFKTPDVNWSGQIIFENDSIRIKRIHTGNQGARLSGTYEAFENLINLYKNNFNLSNNNSHYFYSNSKIDESLGYVVNNYNVTNGQTISDYTSINISDSFLKSLFNLEYNPHALTNDVIEQAKYGGVYYSGQLVVKTIGCKYGVLATGGATQTIVNTTYSFSASKTTQTSFNMTNVNDSYGILAMPLVDRVQYNPLDLTIYNLPNKDTIISIFQGMSALNEIIDVQIIPAQININAVWTDSGVMAVDSNLKICYIKYGTNYYPLACLYNNQVFAQRGDLINDYIDINSKAQMIGTDFELTSGNYNNNQFIYPYQNQSNDNIYFTIEGTMKPYSTMLRVRYNYKGLNGGEFTDKQGLLINEGFDVTKLTDAWQNYIYNNKNYQKQFDADYQLQKKSFNYGLVSSGVGILGDTLQGATQGALIGGPYGAIAGGVVGSVQGGYNFFESYDLGKSQLKLSKKQFKFNLDNIKSQASNVTSVGDVNFLNKIFPMVCIYQSPNIMDIENYLQYNGMTINAIGNIIDYIKPNEPSFIKATIIRTNIEYSPNIINELNAELEKGIYILKEES